LTTQRTDRTACSFKGRKEAPQATLSIKCIEDSQYTINSKLRETNFKEGISIFRAKVVSLPNITEWPSASIAVGSLESTKRINKAHLGGGTRMLCLTICEGRMRESERSRSLQERLGRGYLRSPFLVLSGSQRELRDKTGKVEPVIVTDSIVGSCVSRRNAGCDRPFARYQISCYSEDV